MKKIICILIATLLVISFTACSSPTPAESPTQSPTLTQTPTSAPTPTPMTAPTPTPMTTPTPTIVALPNLSEIEVSDILRKNITQDTSHEEVISKLESWGFNMWQDINITAYNWCKYIIYIKGDIIVQVGLDIECHFDLNSDYYIKTYKSDQITVNGVDYIIVHWDKYGHLNYYLDKKPYVAPDRVTEQRTIQSFLDENIELGDDYDTAITLIEDMGFALSDINGPNNIDRYYQYGNYKLYITMSLPDRTVNYMTFSYKDVLFDKRIDN